MREWAAKVLNRSRFGRGLMQESAAANLSDLSFESGPVETLYLDEIRVHEDFVGQFGAIGSYTKLATREVGVGGGVETPVLKLEFNARGSLETGATLNLDHPIVQVLVLRFVLKKRDLLCALDNAKPGSYIIFSGIGVISRPGMFEDLHRERLSEHPDLYERLEAERARQEKDLLETDGPKEPLWLLTINRGASVCAATLRQSLLRPPFRHWIHADTHWEILGLCRRVHEGTKVPWLAPLYLCAKFGEHPER